MKKKKPVSRGVGFFQFDTAITHTHTFHNGQTCQSSHVYIEKKMNIFCYVLQKKKKNIQVGTKTLSKL